MALFQKHYLLILLLVTGNLYAQNKTAVNYFENLCYRQYKDAKVYEKQGGWHCDTFFYAATPIDIYTVEKIVSALDSPAFERYPFDTLNRNAPDSIILEAKEVALLQKEIHNMPQLRWPAGLYPESVVVTSERIDKWFTQDKREKIPFQELACNKVYAFSKPVFFRNGTLCIFYQGTYSHIGPQGECWLYFFLNNRWLKYCPVYRWFEMKELN